MIYLTSDLHLGHSREFIYGPRGFNSVEEHDDVIVERFNNVVSADDEVYILGDLMLGNNDHGIELLSQLNGKLHIIIGNHDTVNRVNLYRSLPNVIEISYAEVIKYNGYHFYLSHYPTMTANLEKESLKQCMICLYGHTHQTTNFYQDIPFMYHVGVDSHNCYPVSIDTIIEDCKAKVEERKNLL